ncbi:hypothetical protein AGOR_G00232190 [Albula goreensis]|uniref:Uncharacterized protein n=1 Tax=Albula goreensis TaxID=1534307 RepID=A0A8T3CK71_9TELE|nr:hypothetical protein AGOR_G00232190 [Albula goreensis]
MNAWTPEVIMKSSTARSLHVFCLSFLCLLALHVVTGNNARASETEGRADTDTGAAAALPISASETKSSSLRRDRRDTHSTDTKVTKNYAEPKIAVVVLLFIILIVLIVALVYFYRRLNQVSDGEYTIDKLINGKDGARERAGNAVRYIENRFGVRLRPRKRGDVEEGEEEEEREEQEQEQEQERVSEKDAESQVEDDRQEEDSSDDYSSLEGCDLRERKKLQEGSEKRKEGRRANEDKKEEEKEEIKAQQKEEKETEGEENRRVVGQREACLQI